MKPSTKHKPIPHNPNPREIVMPTKKKPTDIRIAVPPLPVVPSLSTSAAASPPTPVEATSTPTAPQGAVVMPAAPPSVVLPPLPAGFVPANLKLYRGSYPKKAQLTALPNAIAELESSSTYASVFGAYVPPANQLAEELTIALQWTTLRVDIEAFLVFVKTGEVVSWKRGLSDLDKLNTSYQVVVQENATLVAAFPGIGALLDVPKGFSKVAAATRARNVKAKAAEASAVATAAPVAATAAPSTGGTAK
jgi:hypothetical protein